jgi:hypothetical protein
MLLLTYDPNVKPTPDYKASLVSPYGSMVSYQEMHAQFITAFVKYMAAILRVSKGQIDFSLFVDPRRAKRIEGKKKKQTARITKIIMAPWSGG